MIRLGFGNVLTTMDACVWKLLRDSISDLIFQMFLYCFFKLAPSFCLFAGRGNPFFKQIPQH